MAKNIFRIPNFLQAPSPEKLKELMLLNNLKNDQEFLYFDIQKDGSFWIAWFWAHTPPKTEVIKQVDAPTIKKSTPKKQKV